MLIENNPQLTQHLPTYPPSVQPPTFPNYQGFMQQPIRMQTNGLVGAGPIQQGMFQPTRAPRMAAVPNFNPNPTFQVYSLYSYAT